MPTPPTSASDAIDPATELARQVDEFVALSYPVLARSHEGTKRVTAI